MEKIKKSSLCRRDYKRIIANASASLVTDEKVEIPLILKDLSVRGMSVVGDYPFQKNERIKITIYAPPFCDKPVLKQAKVVWSKKTDKNLWEAGLDFGMGNLIQLTQSPQNI